MHAKILPLAIPALFSLLVEGRGVPENIRAFKNMLQKHGSCNNKLMSGFYSTYEGPNSESHSLLYITSTCLDIRLYDFYILDALSYHKCCWSLIRVSLSCASGLDLYLDN